eukprot:scaffold55825_cov27-Tisochrysis_lutea.AAC.4
MRSQWRQRARWGLKAGKRIVRQWWHLTCIGAVHPARGGVRIEAWGRPRPLGITRRGGHFAALPQDCCRDAHRRLAIEELKQDCANKVDVASRAYWQGSGVGRLGPLQFGLSPEMLGEQLWREQILIERRCCSMLPRRPCVLVSRLVQRLGTHQRPCERTGERRHRAFGQRAPAFACEASVRKHIVRERRRSELQPVPVG